MIKRHKWLPYAVVATGVVLVLLLVFAINSDPVVRWFPFGSREAVQERGPERAETKSFTWQEALGTALFSVFILALVLSHLVLLVVAANLLNKPQVRALKTPAVCPQCDHSIKADWRLCPYCGFTLTKSSEHPPTKRQG
jgi:hypothetical protein